MKRRPGTFLLKALIALLLIGTAAAQSHESGYELYHAGKIDEARKAYHQELRSVKSKGDQPAIWQALMGVAWFEDETGNHKASIEYSNQALEIATKLDDHFMIGRTLSWLGWAYSSMGLYELALKFYDESIDLGAPEGKIRHVALWGLSTQEKGAIYFRMGDVKEARRLIEQTTNYAREHGIDVGVAEGGAHLAEISLVEGKFDEAEKLAHEAEQAAIRCDCSPNNISRAKVVLARVAAERARVKPELKEQAITLIQAAIDQAQKTGNVRYVAEGQLLLSKTIPASDFQKKFDLVSAAFQTLADHESEMRGTAEAEMGQIFLEKSDTKLARFYLKNGYKVNKELFRRVDNAHILKELAKISAIEGDQKAELEKLVRSADRALESGAIPLALEIQTQLSFEFEKLGYQALAGKWGSLALQSVDTLLKSNNDDATRERLLEVRLKLMELLTRTSLDTSLDKRSIESQ